MNKFLFLLFLSGAGLVALAQQSEPLKIYFVPRTSAAMTVETMTQDAFWRDVPRSSPFVMNVPTAKESPATDFQAVYNDACLFVRINAVEPLVDKMPFQSARPGRDDTGAIFKVCNVEFFIDPNYTRKDAAQIVASINGGIYDAMISGNIGWIYTGLTVKTVPGASGWTMTAAFPWKDYGVDNVFGMYPHSNPVLGFNICRGRRVAASGGTQWAKTPPNSYPRPEQFGILLLSEEKDAISTLRKELANAVGGIMLQGAVKNAADIYRIAMNNALTVGEVNGRMLPEPRRSQVLEEFRQIRKKMLESNTDAVLSELLARCAVLNAEISAIKQNLSDDILDEI